MKSSTAEVEERSVAVIGMACRLPGAADPDQLWEVLRHGLDATSDTPTDRYDVDALYSPEPGPGMIGTRRAGYVSGIADFDAEFFGISAGEAVELDPQQRLLLMATWEALEDAGQRPEDLAGTRTGVFVGAARSDFLEEQYRRGLTTVNASSFQNYRSLLPARISHSFDLRGPSVAIDTACSSSLTAIHSAVLSLRARETPLAIAAGVNLLLRPDEGVLMTQAGGIAHDGRSKFGDADADGFAPSDGVGVVILKPLRQAIADGDRIRAVIQGSAISNDGATSQSVLTPSLAGQIEVLRWAHEDAGIAPADVDFVEAHGSGSPTLDPIEITALGQVLGEGRPADRPCLVGSVKTNIGHAEAAGGIAGLIKTVLALEYAQVPPSLHVQTPNPKVDWAGLPIAIATRPHDLPETGRPAIAGISGQGSSTLNAHLVVRQGETVAERYAAARRSERPGEVCLLTLSARSIPALQALVRSYADYLSPGGRGAEFALRDICFSAATRRQHHAFRLAVVAGSHEEMLEALRDPTRPTQPEAEATPLAAIAEQYRRGHEVRWESVFGPDHRFVQLPRYPWQTQRFWPGEHFGSEHGGGDLATTVLREHARTAADDYPDGSLLSDMGIDSLARVRIILRLASDHGYEVEAEELAQLRTVGDFRNWLHVLEAQAA
ncbi:beta-ketoacyl synthase N-terminal-like domain-containing protein [Streptomyces sp. NBRC 109706]|uniref:beta-ketoacyl synthase N-terminal-like domain-containing protein n=1 Tax=Streptomyces sp. NBRC 109706 TaxID=1550035 RepID=UPI000A60CAA2|nr:beta-ketoacyl synthase N-terminal-like domain-containing protein [Streptomyces sp. NBRC 109706]